MLYMGGTPLVPQLVLQSGMNEKHCMHVMTGGNSSRTTAGAPNWDEKWKALIRKSSKNLRHNFLSEIMLMNQTKVGPANRKWGWAVKSCRELPNEKIHLASNVHDRLYELELQKESSDSNFSVIEISNKLSCE